MCHWFLVSISKSEKPTYPCKKMPCCFILELVSIAMVGKFGKWIWMELRSHGILCIPLVVRILNYNDNNGNWLGLGFFNCWVCRWRLSHFASFLQFVLGYIVINKQFSIEKSLCSIVLLFFFFNFFLLSLLTLKSNCNLDSLLFRLWKVITPIPDHRYVFYSHFMNLNLRF
jgi:hypothetical protein